MKTLLLFFCLLFCSIAQAQFTQQGNKLVGTGATGFSRQGSSVGLSSDGNTAIVGGHRDNNFIGSVWVYTRNGSTWIQQGPKLTGTGSVGPSEQGFSVSLSSDGNTALVGGGSDNGLTGAAWVFTRGGGTWTQQGSKLVGTGAIGSAAQGYSVSISADGNTAIIGGNRDNTNAGAAWVFTRSGDVWSQQGTKLVGTGAVGVAQQGSSVSISADGNTVIIGGSGDDDNAGAAWVFTRSGNIWTQQGSKLVGTGGIPNPTLFAISVALSSDGNTAMIGRSADNLSAGAVWVFVRNVGVWSQQGAKLVGTGAMGNSSQGYSVSLSSDGNNALVGGWLDNTNAGAVWMFTRNGTTWIQTGEKLVGTGGVGGGQQGFSVALSSDGSTAMVGGWLDNGQTGATWVFTGTTTEVQEHDPNLPSEFSLQQNYPNPFNPSTSIQYAIASRQFVTLKVYDILGNAVATLVNEEKPAGSYEVNFDSNGLSSGVYFYKLIAGSFSETKKMILMR
jgi:hypothetical protein